MNNSLDRRYSLNALITDCNEFREMQALIGQFNIFRILGIEDKEIRHSNMLAWLLSPHESHGLADRFLKQYLMLVSHDHQGNAEFPDPILIDTASINSCTVLREIFNIDLLVDIEMNQEKWLFVVENKVNARQGTDQLARYKKSIKSNPLAIKFQDHKIFCMFLTKDGDEPYDHDFVISTYDHVHRALKIASQERKEAIGNEPYVLIQNYLELLEQKFMSDSTIQNLARLIYKNHKLAIDTIIDNLPDPRDQISEFLMNRIEQHPGWVLLPSSNSAVRFLPKEWDTPGNRAGRGWGANVAYIIFVIELGSSSCTLKIISGHAPVPFVKRVFSVSQSPLFTRQNRELKESPVWVTYHSQALPFRQIDTEMESAQQDEIHYELWEEVKKSIDSEECRQRVALIKEELVHLK